MALTIDALGDRWLLLILRELFYGVSRFDDLLADLGAPRSTLSARLSKLVELGIVTREPYQEPGQRTRHRYVLTGAGRDFALPLIALTQWGEVHITGRPAPVQTVHRKTGVGLRVELRSARGQRVTLDEGRIRKR